MSNAQTPSTQPAPHRFNWKRVGTSWRSTAPGGWELYYGPPEGRVFPRFRAELTLSQPGRAPAELRREDGYDRMAKRVGYAVEHQTGDPDFDRVVYLASNNPSVAQALAGNAELRRAILDLFEEKISLIEVRACDWTVPLRGWHSPGADGSAALSRVARKLCAVSDLWPSSAGAPPPQAWTQGIPGVLSVIWFAAAALTVLGRSRWGGEEGMVRQIDTFATPDWLGMGLLFLLATAPFAIFGGGRAWSHRTLLLLIVGALALLPFSERLLQVDINKLHDRSHALAPVAVTELRIDPERKLSRGYLLSGVVEDRPIEWKLDPEQGAQAAKGRLCVAAVVAEGLRGLRYVNTLRAWICRPGEISPIPAPPSS